MLMVQKNIEIDVISNEYIFWILFSKSVIEQNADLSSRLLMYLQAPCDIVRFSWIFDLGHGLPSYLALFSIHKSQGLQT